VRGILTGIADAFPAGWAGHDSRALEELDVLAEPFGGDVEGFLRHVTLGFGPDACLPKSERVSLLTLHASKGLEFPCVFIVGCEDGLVPLTLFDGREADLPEERRLLYVGMTRARLTLILSHARRRFLFGRELRLPPSRWLERITGAQASQVRARRRKLPSERQLDLF
jgi:DNA helicase II / ATP-dependent DNA helicase PcrA